MHGDGRRYGAGRVHGIPGPDVLIGARTTRTRTCIWSSVARADNREYKERGSRFNHRLEQTEAEPYQSLGLADERQRGRGKGVSI